MLFIGYFRMTHAVFHDLYDKLPPYIQRQDIRRRPAVPAELKVAVAAYKLAHGQTYKAVPVSLGIVRATYEHI